MSIAITGKQVSDGLVLCCDTFNRKSYVGQPTTNYVTYPLANWNGSAFVLSYNYANNGVSYTFDTSVATPIGDFSGVMKYYTGNTDYKYWSILMSGLSSGTYAFSYYAKASVAGGINNQQLWRDSGTDRSVSGDWNPSYTTEWKRYVTVGPISVGNYLDYFPIHSGALTGGVYVYFWGFQLEKLSYATQFANGSRSNTQGLLDLTGNYSVSLSSAEYDSSADITYSSTGVVSAGNLGSGYTNYTIECWFNSSDIVNYRNVFDANYTTYSPNTGNVGPRLEQYSNGTILMAWSGNTSNNSLFNTSNQFSISPNRYNHFVMTCSGGTMNFYLNGQNVQSNVSSAQGYVTSFADVKIGVGFALDGSRYFRGKIPKFAVYKRVLTAAEVLRNYSVIKRRYGL